MLRIYLFIRHAAHEATFSVDFCVETAVVSRFCVIISYQSGLIYVHMHEHNLLLPIDVFTNIDINDKDSFTNNPNFSRKGENVSGSLTKRVVSSYVK